MENKLKLTKKPKKKGEDDYKVFSVRIKNETVARLDAIAAKTNRSRNELVNICVDFAVDKIEFEE